MEEYYAFEGGKSVRRKNYDGINITLNADLPKRCKLKKNTLSFIYTTGHQGVFDNNTFRLEWTFNFDGIPFPIPNMMLWFSEGYNSDLVDYYKKTSSFGFAFALETKQ